MLDDLYRRYGQLMIQAEIIQGKINETKRQIADEMGRPVKKEEKGGVDTAISTTNNSNSPSRTDSEDSKRKGK